jgi:hypothetical protein
MTPGLVALVPHVSKSEPTAFAKEQYSQVAAADLAAFYKPVFDHAWISAIEGTQR